MTAKGMTLADAIGSNRPFRRIGTEEWFDDLNDKELNWEIKKEPREWELCIDKDGFLSDPRRQWCDPSWPRISVIEDLG